MQGFYKFVAVKPFGQFVVGADLPKRTEPQNDALRQAWEKYIISKPFDQLNAIPILMRAGVIDRVNLPSPLPGMLS